MDLDQLFSYQHAGVAVGISAIIMALKKTLTAFGFKEAKFTEVILSWMPLLLGAAAGAIPGVILGSTLGIRMFVGIALGGISGQAWKMLNSGLKLRNGKNGSNGS